MFSAAHRSIVIIVLAVPFSAQLVILMKKPKKNIKSNELKGSGLLCHVITRKYLLSLSENAQNMY